MTNLLSLAFAACCMAMHLAMPFTITNHTPFNIQLNVTCTTGPHGWAGYYATHEHQVAIIAPGQTIAVSPTEVVNGLPAPDRYAHEMDFHGRVMQLMAHPNFAINSNPLTHSTIHIIDGAVDVDAQQPHAAVVPGIYSLRPPAAVESKI